MHSEDFLALMAPGPGVTQTLRVLRYGTPGRGPKAYLQAGIHADEVPALLVAQRLAAQLAALDRAGLISGEVVLVPVANPIGLSQRVLGQAQGRFDVRNGVNFNRGYAELAEAVAQRVEGRLGDDPVRNTAIVRAAMRDAATLLPATYPAQDLKRCLLRLAVDADVVLDLHCDGEALMHLYALTPHRDKAGELGALLGARAVLLADESGDSPFDEACSRPWALLRQRFSTHPIALACFAATVELRGEADVDLALAEQDAQAIVEFLRRHGMVAGTPQPMPPARCDATPLTASEPIEAPSAGVVLYRAELGAHVDAGQVIADLVDPGTGQTVSVSARGAGLLYARGVARWAAPGQRLAKIAGTTLVRTGRLLSP